MSVYPNKFGGKCNFIGNFSFTVHTLSLQNIKTQRMRRIFLTGVLVIAAIALLTGCGGSRKLGCPSVAKNSTTTQQVVS
jgi:predicted small lipoprotein YifL